MYTLKHINLFNGTHKHEFSSELVQIKLDTVKINLNNNFNLYKWNLCFIIEFVFFVVNFIFTNS